MALVNNSSYIPSANEFRAHWAQVDTLLAPGQFVLPEEPGIIPPGFNLSGLTALRDLLLGNLQTVQDKLNGVQISSGGIRLAKAKIYKRLGLFLDVVDGYYSSTDFFPARPEAPGIDAGEERFVGPLRDMLSLWARLNAGVAPAGITLPLVLNEGTPQVPVLVTLAQFTTGLEAMQQRYADHKTEEQSLLLARTRRDKTMKSIRAVLVKYRAAVVSKIAGDEELIATIPRVTPEPGHTPEKVEVSAGFQAPNKAVVAHTESDDADFKEYQLLGAVGDDADLEDAVLLDTHAARVPVDFVTTFGLATPGSAVSLWVVVRTNDGNERTSDRAVVQRPA